VPRRAAPPFCAAAWRGRHPRLAVHRSGAGRSSIAAKRRRAGVELHTGSYATPKGAAAKEELARIVRAAAHAEAIGLECMPATGSASTRSRRFARSRPSSSSISPFLIGEAIFHRPRPGDPPHARDGQGARRNDHRHRQRIVDIRRIEQTIARFGARSSSASIRAGAQEGRVAQEAVATYAKRFAAKEACAKELGTGFRAACSSAIWAWSICRRQADAASDRGAAERLEAITPAA